MAFVTARFPQLGAGTRLPDLASKVGQIGPQMVKILDHRAKMC